MMHGAYKLRMSISNSPAVSGLTTFKGKKYIPYLKSFTPKCILMRHPIIFLQVRCTVHDYNIGREDVCNYGSLLKIKLKQF